MNSSGMNTKKYHKVVRSRPMDLSRIVNPNETLTELKHTTGKEGLAQTNSFSGAKVVQYKTFDGTKEPLLDNLSAE